MQDHGDPPIHPLHENRMRTTEQDYSNSPLGLVESQVQKAVSYWNSVARALAKCSVGKGQAVVLDSWKLRLTLERIASAATPMVETEVISQAREWATSEQRRAVGRFEEVMVAFAKTQSASLQGRFPSYILNGHLSVKVFEHDGTTRLGTKLIQTATPEIVIQHVADVLDDDKKRGFKPLEFVEQLYAAYHRALGVRESAASDTSVPVREVFSEIVFVIQPKRFRATPCAAAFVDYSLDMFARDLARLVAGGQTSTREGHKLHLNPASRTKEAVAIVVEGGLRFIGRIAFA